MATREREMLASTCLYLLYACLLNHRERFCRICTDV